MGTGAGAAVVALVGTGASTLGICGGDLDASDDLFVSSVKALELKRRLVDPMLMAARAAMASAAVVDDIVTARRGRATDGYSSSSSSMLLLLRRALSWALRLTCFRSSSGCHIVIDSSIRMSSMSHTCVKYRALRTVSLLIWSCFQIVQFPLVTLPSGEA